jgi:hypothetical protein
MRQRLRPRIRATSSGNADASAETAFVEMRNQAVYKPGQGGFSAAARAAEQNALALLDVQGNIAQALCGRDSRAGFSILKADVFYLYNSGAPPIAENTTSAANSADTR